MNKVIDSMLAHRSIRSYTDRTVSDEDLNSIIRAVQAAPNWVNLQLVSIIAVKNTDHRRRKYKKRIKAQRYDTEASEVLYGFFYRNRCG